MLMPSCASQRSMRGPAGPGGAAPSASCAASSGAGLPSAGGHGRPAAGRLQGGQTCGAHDGDQGARRHAEGNVGQAGVAALLPGEAALHADGLLACPPRPASRASLAAASSGGACPRASSWQPKIAHGGWVRAGRQGTPCSAAGLSARASCSSATRNSSRRLMATCAFTSWEMSCGSMNSGRRSTCAHTPLLCCQSEQAAAGQRAAQRRQGPPQSALACRTVRRRLGVQQTGAR